MSKSQQRQIIRERVEMLTGSEKAAFSHRICQRLASQPELQGAKVILSYLADEREVNVDEFNQFMAQKGAVICYPVVRGEDMEAYYCPQERYVLNGFGIREPERSSSILIDREAIDLVIVPCVGFDAKMNRLGHGKGYYDRFLAGMDADRVAVAFEAQRLERIETTDQDIRMNKVVTEDEVYRHIELFPGN